MSTKGKEAEVKSAEATPLPPEGVPFGRYLVRKRIAKGGMGEVLLADQVGPLGPVRPVALKRMLPRLARDPRAARMFLDEMATAAQLNHPNIATTYDFGEVDGMYFIAMEYVEGLTLHDLLASLGPLPVGAALSIIAQVAEALSYAHTRKNPQGELSPVVHRDVSPHNVMISSSGAVKLLDFGIARAEQALVGGRLEGKLNYAAPEQLQGQPPDRRSDLWALGVVLYEALTGARPFERDNPIEMLQAAISQSYAPLEQLRPEAAPIKKVVERALLKDATRRWPTAEGFRAACLEMLEQYGGATAQTLAQLVAQAGGPRQSVLGVEAFTSLNLGAAGGLGATADPVDGPKAPLQAMRQRTPAEFAASNSLATGEIGLDAAAPPRGPRLVLAAILGIGAAVVIIGLLRPENVVVPIVEDSTAMPVVADVKAEIPTDPKPVVAEKPAAIEKPAAEKPAQEAAAKPDESALDKAFQNRAPPKDPEVEPAKVKKAAPPLRKAPKTDPHKRLSAKALPTWDDSPPEKAAPEAGEDKKVEAAVGVGLLSVRAVPWAKVTLDGRFLGNSPLANLPVQAGTHTILLTPNQGEYPARKAEIRVRAGSPTRVVLDFQANKLTLDQP